MKSFLPILIACATAALLSVPSDSQAQSRDLGAQRLILDDGSGTGKLTISYQGPGNSTLVIPPGGGSLVTGTGTNNFVPKWTGTSSLTNSLISDNGSTVSITNGALLLSGATGATPASGAGTRMMWIPAKSAFRVGTVAGSRWDDASIGIHSVALGYDAQASGDYSTAIGAAPTASGFISVALGDHATASGNKSTAMGEYTISTGNVSTTMGAFTNATNSYATAMGSTTTASGHTSLAGGYLSVASGDYSHAIGYNTTASGYASTALGISTLASGFFSTALGSTTIASGQSSFAVGYATTASNIYAVAMGVFTSASGNASTAMGYTSNASGDYSLATGYGTIASGIVSTAMGANTTAGGVHSFAMGENATVNAAHANSFVYGDASAITATTAANQFLVRASGGTIFYSDNAGTGVSLAAGGNAWASISDSNRKENRLNVNGEDVLNKIGNIWMGSWNYKGQDASTHRHYGPMAQEFFAAFGNDGIGVIGNDTTLATADVDGVTLMAVKALVERTNKLEAENETMRQQLEILMRERASK